MKTKKTKTTKKASKKNFKSGKTIPVPDDGELEAEWNRNQHLNNTMASGRDRMARYERHPPCPKCDARPSVCMMRRPGYAAYRCRQCGYRWEVK